MSRTTPACSVVPIRTAPSLDASRRHIAGCYAAQNAPRLMCHEHPVQDQPNGLRSIPLAPALPAEHVDEQGFRKIEWVVKTYPANETLCVVYSHHAITAQAPLAERNCHALPDLTGRRRRAS